MNFLDANIWYRALLTHDVGFDGRFFVGVTSTGIYCRPVCRIKAPKPENCLFFAHAAAAESQGFRPCLRCRPELAPGSSSMEATQLRFKKRETCLLRGFLVTLAESVCDQKSLSTWCTSCGTL